MTEDQAGKEILGRRLRSRVEAIEPAERQGRGGCLPYLKLRRGSAESVRDPARRTASKPIPAAWPPGLRLAVASPSTTGPQLRRGRCYVRA